MKPDHLILFSLKNRKKKEWRKRNEWKLRDMVHYQTAMLTMRIPEEEKLKGVNIIFEEIIAKKFSSL